MAENNLIVTELKRLTRHQGGQAHLPARQADGWLARVKVNSASQPAYIYEVKIDSPYNRLVDSEAAARSLLEWSFDFLLDREPPAAILPKFSLSDIVRYFPEYDQAVRMQLADNNQDQL